MTDKLKPCPFCGGEARITDVFGRTGIVCKYCFAEMRGYLDMTPEEMTRYWNTRKPMDRIVERLEEQENENGVLAERDWYGGMSQGFHEAIAIVKGVKNE